MCLCCSSRSDHFQGCFWSLRQAKGCSFPLELCSACSWWVLLRWVLPHSLPVFNHGSRVEPLKQLLMVITEGVVTIGNWWCDLSTFAPDILFVCVLSFPWTVCKFPYVLAFGHNSLETRLYINGTLTETMCFQNLRLLCSRVRILHVCCSLVDQWWLTRSAKKWTLALKEASQSISTLIIYPILEPCPCLNLPHFWLVNYSWIAFQDAGESSELVHFLGGFWSLEKGEQYCSDRER